MAFHEVRILEAGNRLAFRFDIERDVIEVVLRGRRYEVSLDDYRRRRRQTDLENAGVDFERIAGNEPIRA